MKITPLDIRRKEFKRSVRGYSEEEVDLFLDEVADGSEQLHQQNTEFQDRIRRLEEQVAGNARIKDALERTLVSAQLQADETRDNARKESELILQDAELKARSIVSDSLAQVQRVQQALIQLKRLEEDFRFKFRSLLEGHLKLLDEAPIDAEADLPLPGEPAPSAIANTPFVAPEPMESVPEYPAATRSVVHPAAPRDPAALAGAAGSSDTRAAVESPAATEPIATADRSATVPPVEQRLPGLGTVETAAVVSGDTENIEQASVFAKYDEAKAERPFGEDEESPTISQEQDPLNGFFFSGVPGGTGEVSLDDDTGAKSKPRDFEW